MNKLLKAFHESLHGISDYEIEKAAKRKRMADILEGKHPKYGYLEFIDLKKLANERRAKKNL